MSLIETETIKSANVHVLECSACGHTCEQVNGDYEYCPHCGNLACASIYESYFSTKSGIAGNWHLLKDLLNGDLTYVERMKTLSKAYTYIYSEDFLKEEVQR